MSDSASLSLKSVLSRAEDLRYRQVLGEGLAIRQSTSEVLGVNEVGSRVLELVDGVTPVSSLVKTLVVEFDVEEDELAKDVLSFLSKLYEIGVVKLGEEGQR